MQFQQSFAPSGPFGEVVIEGDSRKLPAQVELIGFAVGGVVQNGVDVGEDVLFSDAVVRVVRAELIQAPIGDVLEPVSRFVIAVEG